MRLRRAGRAGRPPVRAARLVALAAARTERSSGEAVGARHVIGVAQGILMERHGLDLDRAFEALRRCSQAGDVKLRSVADHVVEHRRLPGPESHPLG